MITFPRSPLVNVGDPVRSRDLIGFLTALRARMKSGAGDMTWRLFSYAIGLFRSMRNSDAGGNLTPAEFEAIMLLTLDPKNAEWPIAGPGEPEGARIDNPFNAFTYGSEAWNLFSEADRLTDPDAGGCPMQINGGDPQDAQGFWDLRKMQSGAFDPETGDVGCPAMQAAGSYYMRFTPRSKAGTSWGGYLPGPQAVGTCLDGSDPMAGSVSLQYVFTRLADRYQVTYPGSCPDVAGDVAAVIDGRFAWQVLLYTGTPGIYTTDTYDKTLWMQGPYTGAVTVTHTEGRQIDRVLARFANEFRGSDFQRAAAGVNKYNLENAFDHGRFLASQYLLAPQIGKSDGKLVNPVYQRFAWQGALEIDQNTLATASGGGTTRAHDPRCVMTSYLVVGRNLAPGETALAILDGTTTISTHTVKPAANGSYSAVVMLDTTRRPTALSCKLLTELRFKDATSGFLGIEPDERMAYKPVEIDRYFLLRVCGARDGIPDGAGVDENDADEISENYFRWGCALNIHGQAFMPTNWGTVNTSAVYDAARRLAGGLRMVRRQNFVGYEVTGGNSVLYFTRYFMGMSHACPIDLFQGIGPDRLPKTSGSLTPGRVYIVRDARIWYRNQALDPDATFTANAADLTWTGAGNVYEYDGIVPAFPTKWDNAWLLDVDLLMYGASDSSNWKPDAYSDYIWFSNRCQFNNPNLGALPELVWQVNYGNYYLYQPEVPSGWNYVKGYNLEYADPAQQLRFYKSCRIYEPPLEIKSVRALIENGQEILRVELNGRLHSTYGETGGAPASIPRDLASWSDSHADEADRLYRTAENGLRNYLYYLSTGNNCSRGVIGDTAADSGIWFTSGQPFGACFPSFRLTRLPPLPYEDGNDKPNRNVDSPLLHESLCDAELIIRGTCEGWVDAMTTNMHGCHRSDADETQCNVDNWGIYDFTYENLCFAATGNPYLRILDIKVRPDNAEAFGPVPKSPAYASIFNALSSMLNLMDTVRIMLPVHFENNLSTYSDNYATRITGADGSDPDFGASGAVAGYWEGTPPAASSTAGPLGWTPGEVTVTEAAAISNATGTPNPATGPDWIQQSTAERADYQIAYNDPDSLYAMPPALRDMAISHGGVLCCVVEWTTTSSKRLTDSAHSTPCGSPPQYIFSNGAGQYWDFENPTTHRARCQIMVSGHAQAAPVGHAILVVGRTASNQPCFSGVSNGLLISPIVDTSNAGAIVFPLT